MPCRAEDINHGAAEGRTCRRSSHQSSEKERPHRHGDGGCWGIGQQ